MAKKDKQQGCIICIAENDFKLVTPPVIQSDVRFIYLEEIKDSGTFKLLSSYPNIVPSVLYSVNLFIEGTKLYLGFVSTDYSINDTYEVIEVTMTTKLNIGNKRLLYIEEYQEGTRLTYSEGLAKELKDIQFIELRRS